METNLGAALAWAIEEARELSRVTHSKARQAEFLRYHELLKCHADSLATPAPAAEKAETWGERGD